MKNVIEVIGKEFIDRYLNEIKYYGYQSLVLNIIDAVYSISAKYESTLKVVERFAKHVDISVENGEYTLSQFISGYETLDFESLATKIFQNRQRTSATNGILKAEAVVRYIKTFHSFHINNTYDLINFKDKDLLRRQIGLIPGHSSGIAFSYLLMLSGDTNTFKPDRHMYNFFGNFLEYGKLTEEDLKQAFKEQLFLIKSDYPKFTIRTLDSMLWNYMKYESQLDSIVTTTKKPISKKNKPYFMNNYSWYYFDETTYKFYLKENAPQEAVDSYNRFYGPILK